MVREHPQGAEAIPNRLSGVLGLGAGLVEVLGRHGSWHMGAVW